MTAISHLFLLLLASSTCAPIHVTAQKLPPANPNAPTTTSSSGNVQPLQFVSPIQSFTIFDKDVKLSSPSPRSRFLPRLKAGLMAERRAREAIMEEQRRGISPYEEEGDDMDVNDDLNSSWAERSAQAEERKAKAIERRVERAYDEAVRGFDERVAKRRAAAAASAAGAGGGAALSSTGGYQFVGVVNDGKQQGGKQTSGTKGESTVTWYARPKPPSATWSLRLLHVNRDAVLRELFTRGKLDVFGSYSNEGVEEVTQTIADDDGEEQTVTRPGLKPILRANYTLKERSWKTLWNYSPQRHLRTPSGSFWRERRIPSGLYTDGRTVYESVYRFRDGRNGMKPVAELERYLEGMKGGEKEETKRSLVERLMGGGVPDVVVEK